MTPGLALFYGGMVRRKNVLSIMMQCFCVLALVSIQWVLFGYSLAFGPDFHYLVGSLQWAGLNGVGADPNPAYSSTIPHPVFAVFQMMFAIITAAVITGSFAERMKFSAFLVFTLLWTTFVYDPLAHWVWGQGGWLKEMGVLDFAGGTVVEIACGMSGLVTALFLGRRSSRSEALLPHNLPLTITGAGLLWFGWLGFNAGSALAANGVAGWALLSTNTSAAAATISWLTVEWIRQGKPTSLGAASGCVAGLVAITPAAGFVNPLGAVVIGLTAGGLCYLAVSKVKEKLCDDALDVFGIHGVGGIIGTLATGLLATRLINPGEADGLFFGNAHTFLVQLLAVLAACAYTGIISAVILKVMSLIMDLRVSDEDEENGLDSSLHGEDAYTNVDFGSSLLAG
jgi:Amt family ammonium transporter